jgi:hypothetical protein
MSRWRSQTGQAAVETVALLPVVVVLAAAAWQLALAGHARWVVAGAARAAARADVVGESPAAAARGRLPGTLERGLRVERGETGEITVSVQVPGVAGLPSPGRVGARSRFSEQS